MTTKQKLLNRNIVQQIVYNHTTTNVDKIRHIMKEKEGCPVFSKTTIHRYLQELRADNEEWITAEARYGYLQTVHNLLAAKKARLDRLTKCFNSDQTPLKIMVDIANSITETEESLRRLMESLPLLAQFNAVMNGNTNNIRYELDKSVIVRD